MTAPLAFIDTETTGLDPERHEIWEVALILRDSEGVEVEYLWQLPVDLGKADPMGLSIGRFYWRRWHQIGDDDGLLWESDKPRIHDALKGRTLVVGSVVPESQLHNWAQGFAELTAGAHLVGAVVSFDEKRLERLLRRNHACPSWHYHIVDVEALAVGWLAGSAKVLGAPADAPSPPWDSEDVSRLLNVDPDEFDKHTALGDARWARAIYDAVMS